MSSKQVHQSQAEHNGKLARELVGGVYYDWACITAFYSALHYVEAKFFDIPNIVHTDENYKKTNTLRKNEDVNINVHLWREVLLKGTNPKSRDPYRHLREVSQQMRYLDYAADKTACDFLPKDQAKILVEDFLIKIKKDLGF